MIMYDGFIELTVHNARMRLVDPHWILGVCITFPRLHTSTIDLHRIFPHLLPLHQPAQGTQRFYPSFRPITIRISRPLSHHLHPRLLICTFTIQHCPLCDMYWPVTKWSQTRAAEHGRWPAGTIDTQPGAFALVCVLLSLVESSNGG